MKKFLRLCATALPLLFPIAAGVSAGASVVVDRVVAVVNGEIITLSDLQREEALKKKDGVEPDARLLLEDMIDRKLQMAAAKREGMDVSEKELSDAVAEIMKRNSMDAGRFETELAKEGLTLEQYKKELREQMTLSRVFNKFVRSGAAVDQAEVRSFYDHNIDRYTEPEEIRVRHLFFSLPAGASHDQKSQARQKAEAAMDRIRKGQDFSLLVRELSESETGVSGGDLGFMRRGEMVPQIEEATHGLKTGEIAGPVLYAGGYHVFQVEQTRKPVKPFETVKEEITRMLYEQKLENTYRTWLQSLRSDSTIENKL